MKMVRRNARHGEKMRLPKKPPAEDFLSIAQTDARRAVELLGKSGPLINGKYLHWDKLRFHTPPEGSTVQEWWSAMKFRRKSMYRPVPLWDKGGAPFLYLITDQIQQSLHEIDLGAGGLIQMPGEITNPETRDQYYVSSLIDEAITSSQLEGASTTRPVAKEMIKTGRAPRDKSERMILNNYLAMQRIGKLKNEELTKELVFEIHRIVTHDTLDDPTAAGRFRRDDEQIRIEDNYGVLLHDPPSAATLEHRMESMCDFANGKIPEEFIPPALQSIILHFWLAYDHPFVDGNGRTARALFYWSMLRHKYWLFEFISISQIILKSQGKYGRAYLYTESDDNDLTYFILYHLNVIKRAVTQLHAYIKRKTERLMAIEAELRGLVVLNHRQRALISHALRHPNQRYTVESHRASHNVVYETARSDLMDLASRNLLAKLKVGKAWLFTPAKDLEGKLVAITPA